jgi:hypothetical protein
MEVEEQQLVMEKLCVVLLPVNPRSSSRKGTYQDALLCTISRLTSFICTHAHPSSSIRTPHSLDGMIMLPGSQPLNNNKNSGTSNSQLPL